MTTIVTFFNLLITVLYFAVIARVFLSWIPMGNQNNPLVVFIYQITEPILAPIRRIVPRIGIFDLTPMIAIFILIAIQRAVTSLGS